MQKSKLEKKEIVKLKMKWRRLKIVWYGVKRQRRKDCDIKRLML